MSKSDKVLNSWQTESRSEGIETNQDLLKFEFIPSTLSALLEQRVHESPHREIYHFVESTYSNRKSLSYSELFSKASKVAEFLIKNNAGEKPVILLFNCDLDYIIAFFGCLLAGQIAVPAYPPTASKHFDRLKSLIGTADAKIALTSKYIFELMNTVDKEKMSDFALEFVCVDSPFGEFSKDENHIKLKTVLPEQVAFLQFTSGSTGEPKGVMLSHKSLMENLKMIKVAYNYSSEDRLAMWLPLYHDMGLIGGVLVALYINAPLFFMPPQSIVRPIKWLRLISDVKATASGGPNFAFDMCLNRISDKEIENLDLSSLRFIASGAEPVRPATVTKFYDRFKQVGLRENVIVPCYGLAETCVYSLSQPVGEKIRSIAVSPKMLQDFQKAVRVSEATQHKIEYVSCGFLHDTDSVKILDSNSLIKKKPLEVGELFLSGSHLMNGYWNNKKATDSVFIEIDGKKFLRTGDLVFFDEDKNIYFCGRNKDMIIVRGKNYYATDIEISVSNAHVVLHGTVNACFSFDKNESESVVLVQEVPLGTKEADLDFFKNQIQQQVVDDHNLHFDDIVFVESGTIKRTSAGKIRRLATKDMYLNHQIQSYREPLINNKQLLALKRKTKKYRFVVLLASTKVHMLTNSAVDLVKKTIFQKNLIGGSSRPK